jgi:hypothetical protein
MKLFGYFIFLIAVIISTVAAYYSIVGLTAIFSAAVIPIIIMGAALEVGKVTAAMWLKLNWHRANITYKLYLVPAVVFLMFLTSMGIFGFLSAAHSDQSLVSGDVQSKIAIYDEKIKTERENIDAARTALSQMDAQVNERLSRSTDDRGAERAVQIRRQQQAERTRLQNDISRSQGTIARLNEERAPIAAEVRKVEAEVGPLKYIAAMIYGESTDTNLLEKAVRWVIILIVAVFDPLALVLMLAALQTLRWSEQDEQSTTAYPPDDGPLTDEQIEQIQQTSEKPIAQTETDIAPEQTIEPEKSVFEQHPYLLKPFSHFEGIAPIVAEVELPEPPPKRISDFAPQPQESVPEIQQQPVEPPTQDKIFVTDESGSYFLNTSTGDRTYPVNPEQVRVNQMYKKSEQNRTRQDIEKVVTKMKEQGIWPNPPESSAKFNISDAIEADTTGQLEELLSKADENTLQTVYRAIISDINKSKK